LIHALKFWARPRKFGNFENNYTKGGMTKEEYTRPEQPLSEQPLSQLLIHGNTRADKEVTMKKYLWLTMAMLMSLLVVTPVMAQRGMGGGMMGGSGYGYGMGGGMMGGRGYGYDQPYAAPGKPLEMKDAKAMIENYLESTRDPNLKLGKIKDKGDAFGAGVVTKSNTLVDKILINKQAA
jgi:hypothetical protein